ncbi:eukaryotic translation initiation factor 5B [Trichogramma pretiosum]|uniref:eukaryotic translation initiation factor 5B n=1 Tax=Trichogramma pretiosum TaxID=7493 RepID=UPI000C719B86|nr:eukaryotic translation initiation factor 5B [Trichogramma pretiosum]
MAYQDDQDEDESKSSITSDNKSKGKQKESKKNKKGKKKANDTDSDVDELEFDNLGIKPQNKKNSIPKDEDEKKKDDSDNEIEKAFEELNIQPSEDIQQNNKSKKKRDDSDDEFDVPLEEEQNEPLEELPQNNKNKQKSKKGKKAKNESDDDLEKELAELEAEYFGQKKPDNKNDPAEVVKPPAKVEPSDEISDEEDSTSKKKKKGKKQAKAEADEVEEKNDDGEEGKKQDDAKKDEEPKEVEGSKKAKGPNKKMIAAMQEALKKAKEEEERLKREAEEKLRQEEEREQARLEKLRKEQEKKDKKKLREKQRKEKLKAEGKLLTNKQKQAQARAQAMLEALKAQGLEMPEVGDKKARPGTKVKPNKVKQQTSTESKEEVKSVEEKEVKPDQVEVEIVDNKQKEETSVVDDDDGLKDAWDASSSESSEDEAEEEATTAATKKTIKATKVSEKESSSGGDEEESESESESESEDDSDDDEDSEDESDEDDKRPDAEKKKEKVRQRLQARRIEAEKKRTTDILRAAVVCVLGHVDTGKTKILDKLRRTNVQDGEAGGITQQIGATNVPVEAIQESTKHVKGFADKQFKIPGLLIIDTPGHESFSNLRNRGSSLCDIAVLVVDIMHGLEPQTIESINLLKAKKCPFVVALNKIDRLYDWQTMNRKDVQDIIKSQEAITQREFEKRAKEVILQFAEQSLNAALFYENPDPRSYVSLVPTSAITGEGMGNLLALLTDACQGPLAKRLMYCEELQATVLEVKALPGLGTTIDCILVNGTLREGDTMVVAGTEGPIVTQIRSLLMPQPMKELRVKNAYIEYREIKAAQGVKIAAKDLEKAIAGLNLVVAQKPDEVEVLKEDIARELSKELGKIKLAERGVFVQASTLGALEALLDFLKSSKIPYAGIRIGPVVKKDVMKASIMLEHDSQYATILAFDVKIERDAQELADSLGVKIFQADIIYHLFDRFTEYKEQLRLRKREENKHIAVFPCKLKVLPQVNFIRSVEYSIDQYCFNCFDRN